MKNQEECTSESAMQISMIERDQVYMPVLKVIEYQVTCFKGNQEKVIKEKSYDMLP